MPRLRFLSILFALHFTVGMPAYADSQISELDKNIDAGKQAFDSGNYFRAERLWLRVQAALEKLGNPDQRIADTLQQLGLCYVKQNKFTQAETAYKQSSDILKGLNLSDSPAQEKLTELSNVYRPINLEDIDPDANGFAKMVGAVAGRAMIQNDTHHIDIDLKNKFQQGVKDLFEKSPGDADGMKSASADSDKKVDAMPSVSIDSDKKANTGKDDTTNGEAKSSGNALVAAVPLPPNTPPLKQIRLDKKITFDVFREPTGGKMRIANIQGISLDVGLWVKVKEFVMSLNDQNNPVAELTAGAFGVDKKVTMDLPANLYRKFKNGLDKFDPFSGQAAAAATIQPTTIKAAPNSADGSGVSSASSTEAKSTSPAGSLSSMGAPGLTGASGSAGAPGSPNPLVPDSTSAGNSSSDKAAP